MAPRINAERGTSRKEYLMIYPEDIIVERHNNVSRWKMPTQARIQKLAQEILDNPVGQMHPVTITRNSEGKPVLVQGYCRVEAIRHINKDLEPDQQMPVKCSMSDVSPEQAALINITENVARNELSHVDIAHAIQHLSEKLNWDDKKIAAFFGKNGKPQSIGWVHSHQRLLRLDNKIKEAVHSGELPYIAALDLLHVADGARVALFDKCMADIAAEEARLHALEADEAEPAAEVPDEETTEAEISETETEADGSEKPKKRKAKAPVKEKTKPLKKSKALAKAITEEVRKHGHKKSRSLPEVKALLQELAGTAKKCQIGPLAEVILAFIQGEYETMDECAKKILFQLAS